MKNLFILTLVILTLSSCSDVLDSDKNVVQLVSKYELVYHDTLNSVITEYSQDTIIQGKYLLGKLVYESGFQLNDLIFFSLLNKDFDTIMINNIHIDSLNNDVKTVYAHPMYCSQYSVGKRYGAVQIFRNGKQIWVDRDTIFVQ